MAGSDLAPAIEVADDFCELSLARRCSALVDRDPASLRVGQNLPRGWHVMMFNVPTRQSVLRKDGAAHLGVTLPDIGLPRLMLGGRQIEFTGDIAIGGPVHRETRQGDVQVKRGRSGRFAIVPVEHRIFVEGATEPAVVETNNYVLREAGGPAEPPVPGRADQAVPAADALRQIVPDEAMLFRYSAITDNPHRIHYDQPYATQAEGYPALVVNGSIPAMFLLEMFRDLAGREPARFSSRNLAPMFCGRPLTLFAKLDGKAWKLWAQDQSGIITFDAQAS